MIETDAKLKKIAELIRRRQALPIRRYVDECMRLHSSMPHPGRGQFGQIPNAILEVNAKESRVAHLRAELMREKLFLEDVQSEVDNHLRAKYCNYLDRFNKDTQTATVNNALLPIARRVKPLENALLVIDSLLQSMDNHRFSMGGTVKALEQQSRSAT